MPVSSTKTAQVMRQHVTSACTACRRSKIKCDGKRPACGQCASKQRSCVFNDTRDKRRISARKSIRAFSTRVKQLQDFIVSQGLTVPPPEDQRNAWTLDALMEAYATSPSDEPASNATEHELLDVSLAHGAADSNILPRGLASQGEGDALQANIPNALPQPGAPSDMSQSNIWPDSVPVDVSAATDADWIWGMPTMEASNGFSLPDMSDSAALMNLFASASGHPFLDLSNQHANLTFDTGVTVEAGISSDDEEDNEVTTQISDRMGGLFASGEGQWRFYGATSNLHFAGGRSSSGIASKTFAQQRLQDAARLRLFSVAQAVDESLIAHLVELYFTWHNASLHVVDEVFFQQARELYLHQSKNSTFYSDFLLNAMCAIGAAYGSGNHEALPTPLSEFFAKRAKALLDLELDDPQVATVQGLAILSSHEMSPGWPASK